MGLVDMSVQQIAEAVRRRDISAQEVVDAFLQEMARLEPQLGAFLAVAREQALEQAKRIDRQDAEVRKHWKLAGVPIAIKDNIVTKDLATTAGSRLLEGFVPPYNATVVERLIREGAVIVGKTNCDEFGMGSSTEYSGYHVTRNPYDLDRVPGGSSGGSAAAVAAHEVPAALGSDTGGSIRQPASFCGVVGVKPTYGRVPRYGLIAYASSLDQIGPMTRSVGDAALVLEAIAGYDPKDATSLDLAVPGWFGSLGKGVEGLRIGVPEEYFGEGLDNAVRDTIDSAIGRLVDMGAQRVPVSLEHTPYAIAAYYLIAPAEASSNLSRYDGVRYGQRVSAEGIVEMYEKTRGTGFGPEVKRRIMLGTHALSAGYYDAYYLKAQKVRTLIRQDFERAFQSADVLAMPTTPSVAFRFGERSRDPLSMYLSDVYTVTANLAGLPAASVPCGWVDGLPVGLQIAAPPLAEELLFRTAAAVERSVPGPGPLLKTGGIA